MDLTKIVCFANLGELQEKYNYEECQSQCPFILDIKREQSWGNKYQQSLTIFTNNFKLSGLFGLLDPHAAQKLFPEGWSDYESVFQHNLKFNTTKP